MKKSFVLYHDQYEAIKDLTFEQQGQLFNAMFLYCRGEELPELDPILTMAFKFFRIVFDRDNDKWEKAAQKNRDNGKKGGRPKVNKNKDLPANPVEPEKPSGLNGNPNNPNEPVSGSVNVSISGNGNDIKDYTPEIKNFVDSYQEYVSDNFENLAPKRTKAFLSKCYDTIEKLTRLDGFTFQEVYDCIQWGSNDDFWSKQIRSLSNIRAKGKNGDTKFVNMMSSFKENKKPHLNKAEQREQANDEVCRRFLNARK